MFTILPSGGSLHLLDARARQVVSAPALNCEPLLDLVHFLPSQMLFPSAQSLDVISDDAGVVTRGVAHAERHLDNDIKQTSKVKLYLSGTYTARAEEHVNRYRLCRFATANCYN